jgi:hypothetical protein
MKISSASKLIAPTTIVFRRAYNQIPELEVDQLSADGKSVCFPQMALVFNCVRRVLKLEGLPPLLKESAEILECGQLDTKFTAATYLRQVEKFGNI